MLQEHIEKLGFEVEDLATGLKGVLADIHISLGGEVTGTIMPRVDEKGAPVKGIYASMNRIQVISDEPKVDNSDVMRMMREFA